MARSRPSAARAASPEPVSWRNGVHLAGTAIWCDARRARDVCFVSAANAVAATRHGQLIGSRETLALLARSDARARPAAQLAVPYDRPFTLGTVRLELIRSGHGLGGASLLAQVDGTRILYAGRIDPRGGGLGGLAAMRTCDVLVVAAVHGDPEVALPPQDEVAGAALSWAREITTAGGTAVMLVGSPLEGLDIATRVEAAGLEVYGQRSIHHAVRRLQGAEIAGPAVRRAGRVARPATVLLWPAPQRRALERVTLPPGSSTALVSGAALEPESLAALGADRGFAWSHDADARTLIDFIDGSGAGRVYVTHRHAERIADLLDRPDRPARVLGPPRQMSLF